MKANINSKYHNKHVQLIELNIPVKLLMKSSAERSKIIKWEIIVRLAMFCLRGRKQNKRRKIFQRGELRLWVCVCGFIEPLGVVSFVGIVGVEHRRINLSPRRKKVLPPLTPCFPTNSTVNFSLLVGEVVFDDIIFFF